MRHRLRRLPAPNTVAAGGTSTFNIPLGPSYRAFLPRYNTSTGGGPTEANMRSEIEKIRLLINGIARVELTGGELFDIMEYYGQTINDGVIPFILARPWMRTIVGEENLVLGTRNLDTLTLEIDIASGASSPDLDLDAWYTPESRDLGFMIEMRKYVRQASGAGVLEISDLPKLNGPLIAAHFNSSAITALEVVLDDVEEFNGDLESLSASQKWTGRVPQTNYVHFEPAWLDRFDDTLPLANSQDWRQKATVSGATTINVLYETLNVPLGAGAQRAA